MTGLVAAACAGVLAAPSPAAAAPEAKAGPHCVVKVATGKTTCYDTFRESIAAATDGRITDAPATPQKAAEDKKFLAGLNAPASRGAAVPMAIGGWLYEDAGYAGRSLTLGIAADTCRNDGRWDGQVNRLGDHGFNDVTSSAWTIGNCLVELHSETNFRGTRNLYDRADWVGSSMNDRASSLRLKSVGEVIS